MDYFVYAGCGGYYHCINEEGIMKKETGEKVFTNWTVRELIGKGAFGSVYRIEREEFGTLYEAAMKKIVIPQTQDDIDDAVNEGMDEQSVTSYFRGFVEEIVNEFKLMAQLKGHTNIVSYEDHMVIPHEDGIGWDILIRMELLKSLKGVTAERNMTEKEVIKLGIDICNALELCGKMNIIHRDIKPENIFVTSLGEYKLGDFGIARTAEKTMSNLSKKGTYTYMAPEVYKGEEYNATVDIYSLGIAMYRFMNYNRAPFLPVYPQPISFSDREASLTKRISEASMPAPACGSKELKRIILKACAYRPSARYRNPAEMKNELENLLRSGEAKEAPEMAVPVQPEAAVMQEEEKTVSVFGEQTEAAPQKKQVLPIPPVVQQPEPKEPEKPKKKKAGLWIGVGAAAALALVISIIMVSGGRKTPTSVDIGYDNLFDGLDIDTEEASSPEEDGIVISSNEYLYGHYLVGGLSMLDWDSEKTFFEDMPTVSIGERDMAAVPAELYCFPEGSVYGTPFLKELLEEIGTDGAGSYASRTYMENDTGEDVFEAIACMLFGDEITPQVHDFYEQNIQGQRDTAELIFVDELKNRETLFGYYKMNGSVMEFEYLDLDDGGRLTLRPLSYEVAFSGKNLDITKEGATRTMEPYRPQGRSDGEIQVFGYVNGVADAYEDISYIFVSTHDSDARTLVSVYFTDGWRADGAAVELGEDNTMTLFWTQECKLGAPGEKRVGEGEITFSYLDCGYLGLIVHADGRDYLYQKTETEYYANLVGDSVIDAELSEETLEKMGMTQMEMLKAMQEAFEAAGYVMGEDVIIDEKTGRITLNNGVLFDVDSAELSEEGKDYLNRIFEVLNKVIFEDGYEEFMDEIIVEGHTDSTGDYEANQVLSEERAAAVDDYCSENDIYFHVSNYLNPVGCSSDELVYDENGNEDRDASRRVVFKITLDAEVFADMMEEDMGNGEEGQESDENVEGEDGL